MKDYSQHGESRFLYNYIKKHNIDVNKLFIDIGALDGITNSNSRIFLEDGWRGILFEPNPYSFSKLIKNINGLNVEYYNAAITDKIAPITFNIVTKKNFEGHSSISQNGKHKVLGVTLDTIISTKRKIGILDIDAEGHDTIIVKNIINSGFSPMFIIIEAARMDERNKQVQFLEQKGYKLINTIKPNTIWERIS